MILTLLPVVWAQPGALVGLKQKDAWGQPDAALAGDRATVGHGQGLLSRTGGFVACFTGFISVPVPET